MQETGYISEKATQSSSGFYFAAPIGHIQTDYTPVHLN